MLGRLRFPVERSRGRRYPEPEHGYRNAFQRDRDRVVHSRAFRRLEAKTQVFTPGLSDHFRNRLTHTIEVAQIARTLANVLHLDEDLTEALALAHDIGHPPFAHAGEHALDGEMRAFGDRFDHNLHALRIVEIFEQRYARFPGLNLSFEVREGIVKHSHDYDCGESADADRYLPGLRPPLEAQLIDLGDEVAYNTADLDDAWAAGLITAEEIGEAAPRYREILETVDTQFPGASDKERFYESLRQLVDLLVTGLIRGTVEAADASGAMNFEDVRLHTGRLAQFTAEAADTSRELKRFLHGRVYASDALGTDRRESMERIGRLFRFFLENPERLPQIHSGQEVEEPAHRRVCDYIAGMTDAYFQRTYDGIFGPDATLRSE